MHIVFGMDFASGVVLTGGDSFIPRKGFSMGSGLAPGGASLFAANREAEVMASLNIMVKSKFYAKVLIMHSMDDTFCAISRSISNG